MFSVKGLVESNCLRSIPSNYICGHKDEDHTILYETENIPTIDFSQLTSPNPYERSKAIQKLGDACRDWGFFVVQIYLTFTNYIYYICVCASIYPHICSES